MSGPLGTSWVYAPPLDEIQMLSPANLVPLNWKKGLLVIVVGGCVTPGGGAVVANVRAFCWSRIDAPGSPEILDGGV